MELGWDPVLELGPVLMWLVLMFSELSLSLTPCIYNQVQDQKEQKFYKEDES